MKRLVLAALFAFAALTPAQALASIVQLDPSQGASALAVGKALMANQAQLTGASLPEYPFEGESCEEEEFEECSASPVAVGDTAGAAPTGVADFPTSGSNFAILSTGATRSMSLAFDESDFGSWAFSDQFPKPESREEANDWTVLKLDVNVPGGTNCMALQYRFLSEEYPEFVGSEYNDAFIAEVDSNTWGVEVGGVLRRPNDFAASPAGEPVSVNGVGPTAMSPEESEGTYFDAATGLVTTKTAITPGPHSVYLSMFDASDKIFDSAVLLDGLTFLNESASTCIPPLAAELTIPPPGTPSPPSNVFKLGSSVKFKGPKATIEVKVPGPGVLEAKSPTTLKHARVAASISAKPKKRAKALILPAKVAAKKAGKVKITVSLSAAGKQKLGKAHKLVVPVQLTFTPTGGTPSTQLKKITFKKPKAHKKGKH